MKPEALLGPIGIEGRVVEHPVGGADRLVRVERHRRIDRVRLRPGTAVRGLDTAEGDQARPVDVMSNVTGERTVRVMDHVTGGVAEDVAYAERQQDGGGEHHAPAGHGLRATTTL